MSFSKNKEMLSKIRNALASLELKNWLVGQWDAQPVIRTSANRPVLRDLALEMIDILSDSLENKLPEESVRYDDSVIELVVGIDKNFWTISTATKDKSSGYIVNTGDKYQLLRSAGGANIYTCSPSPDWEIIKDFFWS